jgi:hypothetical protein
VGHRGHRPACRTEEISPGFIVCNRVPQTYELSRRVELALANVCEWPVFARRGRLESTLGLNRSRGSRGDGRQEVVKG